MNLETVQRVYNLLLDGHKKRFPERYLWKQIGGKLPPIFNWISREHKALWILEIRLNAAYLMQSGVECSQEEWSHGMLLFQVESHSGSLTKSIL